MADNLQKTWKSLQESEERFHIIFNEAADVIVLVNPENGAFVECNDRVRDVYGYSRDEFGAMGIPDLEMIESGSQVKHHVERIMKSGSDSFETMHRSKEGAPLRIFVNARRVMIADEVYILAIFRDITGYRLAEENLKEALLGTVEAIARVSEKRNPFSAGHQQRVAELAVLIGRELDLEEEQIEGIRLASLILDIGEISIPAEVLNRPSTLKPIEFELIKSHTRSGYEIVSEVEMPWPIATILLQHHERLDGSGYPQGLKYDEIAIEARIVAVADVVSAMMSHRPHRRAYAISDVIEELDARSGTLYDEEVVQCCFKVIQSGVVDWLTERG
jgi:PAS domain S-box-containing protein